MSLDLGLGCLGVREGGLAEGLLCVAFLYFGLDGNTGDGVS